MRKSTLPTPSDQSAATTESEWLDLESIAGVELSSEDPEHPFEDALKHGTGIGWKAAAPGLQTIRLRFDEPQHLHRIHIEFLEKDRERAQEFAIFATSSNQQRREVVRQQWSFSPGGSTSEIEEYNINLPDVLVLEIQIDPGRHDKQVFATLHALSIG